MKTYQIKKSFIICDQEACKKLIKLNIMFSGWLWRRDPSDTYWQAHWLLLRHLWRPCHWPSHTHHWQQLQQVLRPPEAVGEAGGACRPPACH